MQVAAREIMTTQAGEKPPVEEWWGFYVEALTPGVTVKMQKGSSKPSAATFQYSVNGGQTWDSFDGTDGTTIVTLANIGNRICIRSGAEGNTKVSDDSSKYRKFVFTGEVSVGGNINSLLTQTETSELPAGTADFALSSIFYGQTNLRDASSLQLPSSRVVTSGYRRMFQGCTRLRSVPTLPATTLNAHCYRSMFQGCTSLTAAPALPALKLAGNCYQSMFQGCTSLTAAPALPATTLAAACFSSMFQGCTSLVSVPLSLPVMKLNTSCYQSMFQGCTSLTAAPALPCTSMYPSCYKSMFQGCTSLTAAPALPADTLNTSCYQSMFQGCTSLTEAPFLPAQTLTSECYASMFSGCSNIRLISTNQTSFTGCTDWVSGVASVGDFLCGEELGNNESIARGVSACPTNWQAGQWWGFYVKAEAPNVRVSMNKVGSPDTIHLEYSLDNGASWSVFDDNGGTVVTIKQTGSRAYFRSGQGGNARMGSNFDGYYHRFVFDYNNCSVGGNINSLLTQTETSEFPAGTMGYTFMYLFRGASRLVDASRLSLPAHTLPEFCYFGLFAHCAALVTPPQELPALSLNKNVYQQMFDTCYKLESAPQILATDVAYTQSCAYMFRSCRALQQAPVLLAATVGNYCYYYMFTACSSLVSIKTAQTSFDGCYAWVNSVASSGIFECPVSLGDNSTIQRGISACPSDWTVVNS